MTAMLEWALSPVMPKPCFNKIILDYNISDVDCWKIIISKCLGYAIILGSVLVKVPQILKLIQAQSGKGVSFISVLLDLTSITVGAVYGYIFGFPISAYGEGIFLGFQTTLIAFLVLSYGRKTGGAIVFLSIYGVIVAYLTSGLAPTWLIVGLQTGNLGFVAGAKLVQVAHNYTAKSTGHLSLITFGLMSLGSLARIFTSIQETGDMLVVFVYLVSSTCNGLIVLQMFWYWDNTIKEIERERAAKAE